MSELFFLIKSLILASLITLAFQVKVGNQTAEQVAIQWLRTSPSSLYLQEISAGGVLFIQNSYMAAKSYVSKESKPNELTEEKSSRLKFEFKRSTND